MALRVPKSDYIGGVKTRTHDCNVEAFHNLIVDVDGKHMTNEVFFKEKGEELPICESQLMLKIFSRFD